MKLKGKVALITGGGTGIGTAIAERFVTEGAKVCITGRRQDVLDKVAQTLPSGRVATCSGDVTKVEDVKRMVETALAFEGKLNVVVNNAGIDPGGTVTDLDPEVWRKVIEINLTGPFLVMKASIPYLIKGGRRIGHQCFFFGWITLSAGDACVLHVKSRSHYAHEAGGTRLRPFEGPL